MIDAYLTKTLRALAIRKLVSDIFGTNYQGLACSNKICRQHFIFFTNYKVIDFTHSYFFPSSERSEAGLEVPFAAAARCFLK